MFVCLFCFCVFIELSSWVFLKIVEFFQKNHFEFLSATLQNSLPLSLVMENYYVFTITFFFKFFMFLIVLHFCFCIWRCIHLKFVLIAFRFCILFIDTVIIWGFLYLCVGTPALSFLFPLCGRILKLFCLLWFLKFTRLPTGNLFLLLFSRRWCYRSSLWFLPCPQPWPVSQVHC